MNLTLSECAVVTLLATYGLIAGLCFIGLILGKIRNRLFKKVPGEVAEISPVERKIPPPAPELVLPPPYKGKKRGRKKKVQSATASHLGGRDVQNSAAGGEQ